MYRKKNVKMYSSVMTTHERVFCRNISYIYNYIIYIHINRPIDRAIGMQMAGGAVWQRLR